MNIGTNVGRWRPVQGLFQAYAIYSGVRGLIAGPVPGQAIASVIGPGPTSATYLFYGSLLLGGVAAMIGEVIQLLSCKDGVITRVDRMCDGLYIESAGDILISLNYLALMFAVLGAPTVAAERAIVYLALGLGFLGRFCQASLDINRLKSAMRKAGIDV